MPEDHAAPIAPAASPLPPRTISAPEFDSGYEAKFDFPRRSAPPAVRYMIATTPRSGSTYLSHLLWQTGCLGAPLEYLDFAPHAEGEPEADRAASQRRRWEEALATRTSPNGVFGFKCFLMHLRALGESNEALLEALMPTHIVFLDRRDQTAQSVSYARAHLTGVWCKEQSIGTNEQVPYSRDAVERAKGWIVAQNERWSRLFDALGVEPLHLVYEDVVAQPQEALAAVAGHLGVALAPQPRLPIPPVERQSGAESRRWREAYLADLAREPDA
ncbi:MAG: hypothetical protein JO013_06805 [Alphaproteobacteria bacterium]|nr:hypothetical protein [Alphaproteobacteria bacterium]